MSRIFWLHLGLLLSLTTFAGSDHPAEIVAATQDTTLAQDPHTEICKAALDSKSAVRTKAFELKIGRRELNRIRCNDMSVMVFAQLHGNEVNNWSIATVQ